MHEQTKQLFAAEIARAERSARRSFLAVACYGLWLVLSTLTPALEPQEGWTLAFTAAYVAGYAVVSVTLVVALVFRSWKLLTKPAMRRVIGTHLAPFWMVFLASVVAGGAAWSSVEGGVDAVFVGIGSGLAFLTTAYAIARVLEARRLRNDRRHLAYARDDAARTTWIQELRARLSLNPD